MKVNKSFFQRRYSELRLGHGSFLAFLLQLGNFTIIGYALFVARVFPGMAIWQFVLIFLSLYMPTAILLGRWYRKHQYRIDMKLNRENLLDELPSAKPNTLLLDFMEYYLEGRTDGRAAELREKIRKQRG